MNIEFEIKRLNTVNTEDRGQVNKILAYVDGELVVDGQKLGSFNGLRLQDSKFYNKKIVDVPQTRGNDGQYRNVYNLSSNIKDIITRATLHAYEARQSSTEG